MISPAARQKDLPPCQARRWFEACDPPLLADGRAGVPGLPAVSATRRCRQSKPVAENAGIDGNEGFEFIRVTVKSLAEIADIPCKYFARETVRSFTVSLWGGSPNAG